MRRLIRGARCKDQHLDFTAGYRMLGGASAALRFLEIVDNSVRFISEGWSAFLGPSNARVLGLGGRSARQPGLVFHDDHNDKLIGCW